MTRSFSLLSVVLTVAALSWLAVSRELPLSAQSPELETARGRVFHDENGNRQFDEGEPLLAGIRVSNGSKIVTTNDDGEFELPVTDDSIVFVIKPSGWRTPLSEHNLPQFYYIHKPGGSPTSRFPGVAPTGPLPESIDFPLTPQEEPDIFKAILFGDTQPRNQQEVDWITHDVIEPLIGTDASFGVTLGDIAFDNLDTMEPLNKAIALLGIPWYNVMGNHDINYDADRRRYANETFERIYGPSYYSFDYGQVHFLVLDDIEWLVNPETGKGRYRGGIGEEQLEFIRNDLAMIPEDQMVVLMMHIPLTNVNDRHGLYRLIEKRPLCISISGHTHHHQHVWITHDDGWEGPQPHHHIINVTVCGSWWSGARDERGIPHATMADGAPNGYSIITFDGTDYQLDFYAAGRSPDYQMQIHAPEEVTSAGAEQVTVYANVFNGSEKSVVRMRVAGGDWIEMQLTREPDPTYVETYEREEAILQQTQAFRKLPKPKASTHLWKANLPANLKEGTHAIEIEARDMWDRIHRDRRVIRVTAGE